MSNDSGDQTSDRKRPQHRRLAEMILGRRGERYGSVSVLSHAVNDENDEKVRAFEVDPAPLKNSRGISKARGVKQPRAFEIKVRAFELIGRQRELERRARKLSRAHLRDGLSIYGTFLGNSRRRSNGALEHLRRPEVSIYGIFARIGVRGHEQGEVGGRRMESALKAIVALKSRKPSTRLSLFAAGTAWCAKRTRRRTLLLSSTY